MYVKSQLNFMSIMFIIRANTRRQMKIWMKLESRWERERMKRFRFSAHAEHRQRHYCCQHSGISLNTWENEAACKKGLWWVYRKIREVPQKKRKRVERRWQKMIFLWIVENCSFEKRKAEKEKIELCERGKKKSKSFSTQNFNMTSRKFSVCQHVGEIRARRN